MNLPAFPHLLPALTTLLQHRGTPIDEATLIRRMEIPWLFLNRDGRYLAGLSLLTPPWLNLALQPIELAIAAHPLTKEALLPFLQNHAPLLLELNPGQWLCITSCEGRQIHCVTANEPCVLPFNRLLQHLHAEITAYTLESAPAGTEDFIPLLSESLRTLSAYRDELHMLLPHSVTRAEMYELHQKTFRALMADLPPLASLFDDDDLQQELRNLHHQYRHLFIIGEDTALLEDRLTRYSIDQCVRWLQEHIRDRLYFHNAPDELIYPE